MESPSRNPLLLEQNNDDFSSDDESSGTGEAETRISDNSQATVKETYRRSPSTPTDHYNFAYIVFYILGM